MIRTIQDFQLNHHPVQVDLKDVPDISPATKKIFTDLGSPPPESLQHFKMGNRIESLSTNIETLEKKLKEAKDHSIRDKIFSLFKMVLSISLLTAGILGLVFGTGALAAVVFIVGFISFLLLNGYYAHSFGKEIGNEQIINHGTMVFGFLIPPYQAFSRIPRLEKSMTGMRKELETIDTGLRNPEPKIQEVLAQSFTYYSVQGEALERRLEEKVQNIRDILQRMEQHPERSEAGEMEFKEKLLVLSKAQQELQASKAFYQTFML